MKTGLDPYKRIFGVSYTKEGVTYKNLGMYHEEIKYINFVKHNRMTAEVI